MNLAVRQTTLQQLDHRPTVGHRLQLRGGAEVAKEAAAFLETAQCQYRRAQRTLVLLFLPQCHRAIGFHESF
jgi:hypothetical protein